MVKGQFLNNLIFRDHSEDISPVFYRNQVLRVVIAGILLILGLVYTIADSYNGIIHTLPYYFLLILTAVVVIILNRRQYTTTANLILLLFINAMVFIFTLSDAKNGNIFIFFVPTAMAAFVLFDYQKKLIGFLFVILSLVLFLIGYFLDFHIMPLANDSPEVTRINYLLNFVLAFGSSCTLLYSLVNLNFINEQRINFQKDEVKHNRMRFELAIKGSNAGIYEWNILTNTVYNSPVWKKMLGYQDHELPDMTLEDFIGLIHPDFQAEVTKAVNLHLAEKVPYHIEFKIRRKDGSYFWVRDSGLAVWDESGRPQFWVGSIIDVTMSKEAEQQIINQNLLLAKANSELDQFVYRSSHDLRSPLSSILGLVYIGKRAGSMEEIMQCLELIEQRAIAQDILITEIIDYSRNARTDLNDERINLNELIQEIIEINRFATGADRIQFLVSLPDPTFIISDRVRLKSIIENLVNNSIKYRDERKVSMFIRLDVQQTSEGIELNVEDNGIGIKSEFIDKVFEMFYRATENSKGSGLGLFIVREMVQKLKGQVWLTSEYAKGSRFSIFIPQTRED